MKGRLRSPAALAAFGVGGIVLAASVAWGLQVRGVTNWTVMTDELAHVRLALSVADTLSPVPMLRGQDFDLLNPLYPLLLAPFYGTLGTPEAFDAVHLLNVVLMASTAIPAYLLTRAVVVDSRLAAFVVAALAVAVPWMGLTVLVRAEVIAYPAFVWAVLALQRAIAEPSTGRDLVALAALVIASFARTQLLLLAIAFPLAILAHEVGYSLARREGAAWREALLGGLRRSVSEHKLVVLLILIGLPLLAAGLLGGLLGAYEASTTQGSLLPGGTASRAGEHLAIVAVAIGILPLVLALAWGAVTLVRPASKREHAFVVLSAMAGALITIQASAFVVRFASADPQDRYFFYLAPLLFVGMAACVLDRRRLSRAVLGAAAAVAALLTLADFLPGKGPFHGSPARTLYSTLDFHVGRVGGWVSLDDLSAADVLPWAALALGIVAAAALWWAPRKFVLPVLGAVLLTFGIAETRSAIRQMVATRIPQPAHAAGTSPRDDWIDAALPEGTDVAIIPSPTVVPGPREPILTAILWWHTEFWNKRVTSAYVVRGHLDYGPFKNGQVTVDWASGSVRATGATPPPRYLVVSTSRNDFHPRGPVVASSPFGQELIEAGPPYRALWATRGLARLGWTEPGKAVTLRLYGERSRSRRVRLVLEAPPHMRGPRSFRISSGGQTVSGRLEPRSGDVLDADGLRRPQESTTVAVCVPAGQSDARLRVKGETKLPDGQRVGLRVISVRPLPGRCRA